MSDTIEYIQKDAAWKSLITFVKPTNLSLAINSNPLQNLKG